jgi:hypothetical protein
VKMRKRFAKNAVNCAVKNKRCVKIAVKSASLSVRNAADLKFAGKAVRSGARQGLAAVGTAHSDNVWRDVQFSYKIEASCIF